MLIFIDESGNFAFPTSGQRNLSCVGALVVPEAAHNDLVGEFVKLRSSWNATAQELKGNTLSEQQTAQVIELLFHSGCLFFVCATEMSLNTDSMIADFQRGQAEYITADITDAHHPFVRRRAFRTRRSMERMSTPLFLQSMLLTDLVRKVIDQASVHFSMQTPPELGAFKWLIDAKDKTKTAYEVTWELMAAGLIQTKGIEKPGVAVLEGDYSFFKRSFEIQPHRWPAHVPKPHSARPFERGISWNLGKVLYDSLSFPDSKNCCGLQLADILASTFRRALMGRLQPSGYEHLGDLMRKLGAGPVELHLFNANGTQRDFSEYNKAVALIESRSKKVGA
jgi:hypothetical protein